MENKKGFEKLADRKTMEMVKRDLESIIYFDKLKEAHELVVLIKKNFSKYRKEFKKVNELFSYYNRILVRAKFIALPLITNSAVLNLFEERFLEIFDLNDFDIFKKLKYKLINIEVYEERDNFKAKLRRALQKNDQQITKKTSFKTIGSWIKDYNKELGLGIVNNLRKSQYFSALNKNKELTEMEVFKLKTLFNVYEKMKHSTFTPEGFEDDIIVVVKGESLIFQDGGVVSIEKEAKKNREITGPPQTTAEKNIEKMKEEASHYEENSLEHLAVEEEIEHEKKIEELRFMATKFTEGSLEKKAIEEELKKMEHQK